MDALRLLRDFISGRRYYWDEKIGMNYGRTSGALV